MEKHLHFLSVSQSLAFGVGCFHFGIRTPKPRLYSDVIYMEELREGLQSIDAVSDVSIDWLDPNAAEIMLNEQPEGLGEDDYFPSPQFLRYSYSIYIPFRIQAEILDHPNEAVDTGSEHFLVLTHYTFFGPVTFVVCKGAGTCAPSRAVQVVREYLERQINTKDLPLRFEFIGPSPFHVDFFLLGIRSAESSGENEFETEYAYEPGYDRVTIRASFSGDQLAFAQLMLQLFSQLEDEFGFFYAIARSRSSNIHSWSIINRQVRSILNPAKGHFISALWAPFRRWRDIGKAIHSVLSFRAQAVDDEGYRHQYYRSIYSSGKHRIFIKKYLDAQIENLYKYPTSDILEMLKFEEERFRHTFGWVAVLAAAILGGIIGAVVTKGLSSSPSYIPPASSTPETAPPIQRKALQHPGA